MKKWNIVLVFPVLFLSACLRAPEHDAAELKIIRTASLSILRTHASLIREEIPKAAWPKAIEALEPLDVAVDDSGVYIRINEVVAAESGYFVPRDKGFRSEGKFEPSYEMLGNGVYWYDIKG